MTGSVQSATIRIYAPNASTVSHISGNKVAVAAGSVSDMPELYADTLDFVSNQVVWLGGGGGGRSGPTSARPTVASAHPPKLGESYIDTTLGAVVFYVGTVNGVARWVTYAGATA